MRHILITSMLALGVGCGAAMAQAQAPAEVQPGGDASCAAGAADCQKGGKAGEQAQGKAKVKTDDQAQGKAGATTEEQAQGKPKLKTDEQAQGKAGTTTEQKAQGTSGTTTEQNAQGTTSTQTDQGSTASITNVTVEQKTEITNVIRETKISPVASVDFDISVGVEVPRHKVRLHRLPPRIVKIVPAYETYEYFVLADGRIVIVDPDTLKIVIILT
ncbi:MAG: DUF1236 domain-containing protein [Mesorhizobium sp.]|uniref:DUF1236 domain-containing protein n=2 Tax=unclassified Mesorhizobium TaxID=325217 RepID=UPI001226F6A8|nr:DUF1236 domain-containing protein [Mesorhizobium sp.]TIW32807.1 MAG: DUF1236 domain-containing protein [Mesorhizobium sp.]